ncbi:MAG: hypothetical protein AAF871_00115 [Pseudomonadota bacterium]
MVEKPKESVSDMMNDWIIDVLADLKTFADKNDLPSLAAELEKTALVAAAEIASSETGVAILPQGGVGHAGRVLRAHGERHNAG